MSVLVTGGTGFVGYYVAKALALRGQTVVSVSRSGTDGLPSYALEEIGSLSDRISFEKVDILDIKALNALVPKYEISGVIHSAAIIQEQNCERHPLLAYNNVLGTVNILELARTNPIEKVVFVGSGTQYPPSLDGSLIKETYGPQRKGLYGTSKQVAEDIGVTWASKFGIPFVSARVSSPYGPLEQKENPDPAHIQFWINKALAREPFHLPGGGSHHRDYTYVDDTAEGIVAIYAAPTLEHSVYNIASGQSYFLREVVSIVREIVPSADISIGEGPLETAFKGTFASPRGALDISQVQQELGYSPKIDFRTGIELYARWLKDHPY